MASKTNGNEYARAQRRNAGRRIDEACHDMHRTPPVQPGPRPYRNSRHAATFTDAEVDAMLREAAAE